MNQIPDSAILCEIIWNEILDMDNAAFVQGQRGEPHLCSPQTEW